MRIRLILLIALLTLTSQAAVIFSQNPANGNGADIVSYRVADDFTLGADSILDSVTFWYGAQSAADLSAVSWAIYADSTGQPGPLLGGGSATPSLGSDPFYLKATFAIPSFSLGAGSYWLELHAGSSLTDSTGYEISWLAVDDNLTAAALQDLSPAAPATPINLSGYRQMAFELNSGVFDSAEVPEPGTAILMIPLAGLIWWRSRKKEPC